MNKKTHHLLLSVLVIIITSCSSKQLVLESTRAISKNPHLLYELDPIESFLTYEGYLIQFDSLKRVPDYSIHRITPNQLKDSSGVRASRKESPDFRVDQRIDKYSAERSDYYKSGYDRGHYVPAGDFVYSQRLKNETFYYSNVSPQLKELNRYGWKYLEEAIRQKVLVCNCEAFVITGALFNEAPNSIGENKVGVPDQLYKIAFFPKLRKVFAFKMENTTSRYQPPLSNYQLTVNELERQSGLDFFERIENKAEEKLESKLLKFK